MQSASVNDVQLEYEVIGAGEPVLLISPVIADGFLPLLAEPALADRYQLIRYHKRGRLGARYTRSPASVAEHAADPPRALTTLACGAPTSPATQAARPSLRSWRSTTQEYVHTLLLLEPSLISVPGLEAFLTQLEPALQAYANGDHAGALGIFMSVVSGLESTTAAALLEERVPGALAHAIRDADTFFGIELPAMIEWKFGAEQAAKLDRPVLSVVGNETQPMWVEVAKFLRSALPQIDECRIDGAGHLLQIQRPEPVARGMAEFLTQHPIGGDGLTAFEQPSSREASPVPR